MTSNNVLPTKLDRTKLWNISSNDNAIRRCDLETQQHQSSFYGLGLGLEFLKEVLPTTLIVGLLRDPG